MQKKTSLLTIQLVFRTQKHCRAKKMPPKNFCCDYHHSFFDSHKTVHETNSFFIILLTTLKFKNLKNIIYIKFLLFTIKKTIYALEQHIFEHFLSTFHTQIHIFHPHTLLANICFTLNVFFVTS